MANILIVDDEFVVRRALDKYLTGLGYHVFGASDGKEALKIVEKETIDLALVDLVMPKMDGVELIRQIKMAAPNVISIVMTAYATISSAVEAIKVGSYHYVTKPFQLDDISSLIGKALEHRKLKEENVHLKRELIKKYKFDNIIGESEKMKKVLALIEEAANTDSAVLILGEPGTGKELVARSIHYSSRRGEKTFITVSCGSVPEDILESELFGHVKGAFEGASTNKVGRFDVAGGGSVFLDEVGRMGSRLQMDLLRVLQDGKIRPVGSSQSHDVDARIIAATNQDIEKSVKEGRFRDDLYRKLSQIVIRIPPLRERIPDIPLLVQLFLKRFNKENNKVVEGITDEAMARLKDYDWPGNVSELETVMDQVLSLKEGGKIGVLDLPPRLMVDKRPKNHG